MASFEKLRTYIGATLASTSMLSEMARYGEQRIHAGVLLAGEAAGGHKS